MVTDTEAIEKAFSYLKSHEKFLENPGNPRLETIQRFNGEWVVVVSYLIERRNDAGDIVLNPLLQALKYQRYFKEFEIDAKSGDIIAMRNPGENPVLKKPA